MAKHKRAITKRPSSRDPLSIQISIRAKLPKGTHPSRALLDEAIRYRIENDEDHPAFKIKIIRWRNPARKGANAAWRSGNQADAWHTLANALRATHVDVFTVRHR